MNEEELKAKEEELKAKEEELKAKEETLTGKEGELSKKEEELNDRESKLVQRETDASNIAQTLKTEYEKKLEEQKAELEARIAQRDEVIKQLASNDSSAGDPNDPFEQLNTSRRAQKAA